MREKGNEEFLDETIRVFQPHYPDQKLNREDARQMIENVSGFFNCLLDWDREEKRKIADAATSVEDHYRRILTTHVNRNASPYFSQKALGRDYRRDEECRPLPDPFEVLRLANNPRMMEPLWPRANQNMKGTI